MVQYLDKLKDFAESIIKIDENLGFKKFSKYVIFLLITVAIAFSYRDIAKACVEFVQEVSDQVHAEKMGVRDEYMRKMSTLLVDLRAEIDADRVLYFEYHNSEENLDGLPFKFFDLMMATSKSGVATVSPKRYQDINASVYIETFTALDRGKIISCHGMDDMEFRSKYRGMIELLNVVDGATEAILFSVPGVNQPIGFIAVEWIEAEEDSTVVHTIKPETINKFLPKLSAVGVSIQGKF